MTSAKQAAERLDAAVHRIGALPADRADAELRALDTTDPDLANRVRRILADSSQGPEVNVGDDAIRDAIRSLAARAVAPRIPLPATLAGFRLIERVAEGGTGTVCLAEQRLPRRFVAVKILNPDLGITQAEFEAGVSGRVSHPGLAHVYEAGLARIEHPDAPVEPVAYIAMEYVQGRPITAHAADHGLGAAHRLALLDQVAETLAHLHARGVVHADLKPANILVDPDGRTRLIDFGMASTERLGRRVASDAVRGVTPEYAAPELIASQSIPHPGPEPPGHPDQRVDIYAFGLITAELLLGLRPEPDIQTSTLRAAMRSRRVPRPMRAAAAALIAASLRSDPDSRPQTMAQAHAAIHAAARGLRWRPNEPARRNRSHGLVARAAAIIRRT